MNVTRPIEPGPVPASTLRAALAAFSSLPRSIKLSAGAALVVALLLAIGVPLSALLPFAGLAGCLGMHLFMGHGGHGGHDRREP